MGDDWHGHRNPFTGMPQGDRNEWTTWDHVLANVLQTIEDYSDQYGLLAWQLDDEPVYVDAVRRIHKFEQARDEATRGTANKPYKPRPGEFFVPRVGTQRSDGKMQTYREWIEAQAAKYAEEAGKLDGEPVE